MKVRRAEDRDRGAVESLWAYCFEKQDEPFFQWYFSKACRLTEVLIGEREGYVACDLHRRPYTLEVRGKAVPVDYIVGVATHPAARGRGLARQLLTGAFHAAREEGKPAVILMPSDGSFYEPLGFAFYAHQWERTATPERLARIGRKSFRAGAVTSPEDWPVLSAVYDAYGAGRSGWAKRDEVFWRLHMEGQLREGYIAAVYDEDGPSGYVWYALEGRKLIVSEFAFRTEAGRRGLYAYLAGHIGSVDSCTWYEPLDDRSFLYWQDGAEHTYIQNKTFPFMMARVTDLVGFLTGMVCPETLSGSITFSLRDPVLPEQEGTYTLMAEGGRLSVERKEGKSAFSLDAALAAQWAFGAASLKELLHWGRVVWIDGTAEAERETVLNFTEKALPRKYTWINEWY